MTVDATKLSTDAAVAPWFSGGSVMAPRQLLRVAISVISLLSLASGAAAAMLGLDLARLLSMLVFCVVGIGAAPWQLDSRLGNWERLAISFVTATAVLVLVPVSMLAINTWRPLLAFWLVAGLCLPLHVVTLVRVGRGLLAVEPPIASWGDVMTSMERSQRGFLRRHGPMLLAINGADLCLYAAVSHRHLNPGFFGFLPEIGLVWYVGLGLILVAISMGGRASTDGVAVFLLVLVLTITPALVYDGPRSQSAAKHVEFIMRIRSMHVLDTTVPIYNAYPGFFAAMAWLGDVVGIREPMRLAIAWPAGIGLMRVLALRYFAGQILRSSSQAWAAVALAVLADSVGADYFSPQSLGFVLGVAALGLTLSKSGHSSRIVGLLLAGLALAVTHQLSPFVVGGVMIVLVVFGLARPWWVPSLVLVPAVAWSLLHWEAVRIFLSFSAVGNPHNFRPPHTVTGRGLERLPVVSETVVALLTGGGILVLLAGMVLLRHLKSRRYWGLALCSAVGLLIVAINPYGQEGVFRAILFGLPWLAAIAVGVFFLRARHAVSTQSMTLGARLGLFAVTVVLAVAFLISSFGLDAFNVIRPADVAAVRYFQEQGGAHPPYPYYLLLLNAGDLPTSPPFVGGSHAVWGRDRLDDQVGERPDLDPRAQMLVLTDRFYRYTEAAPRRASLFALWSPVGTRYARAYGIQSPQQSVALLQAFRRSPFWTPVFRGDGTYLFKFQPAAYRKAVS